MAAKKSAKDSGSPTAVGTLTSQKTRTEGPDVPLEIDGKQYVLRFTIEGLGRAKRKLREEGVRINLLLSLNVQDMDADTLGAVLFGALQEYHSEVSYAAARRMVRFDTYGAIILALCDAYQAATRSQETEPSEGDPPAEG